jgi:hypothetical protein
MTDRTAAALASALPDSIEDDYFLPDLAQYIAERLAESGWRLVHADDPPQTFAEHTAEALALIHDPDPQPVDPAWLESLSHVRVREDHGLVMDPDRIHDHVEASDED